MRCAKVALAMAVLLAAPSVHAQASQGETLLEVASTGEANARPDRATIHAGVTTIALTAVQAAQANGEKMGQLIAALRSAGVAPGDTQTSMVSLNPNQTWNQTTGPQITGYTASNNLTILLRDPKQASAIIAAAFGGGANTVNGPNFTLSADSEAIAAARLDAVKRAREQAEAYAAAFGMKVARVIRISERGQQSTYMPIVLSASRIPAPPAPPPPPPPPPPGAPVETGKIRQSVNLWVDFALVPK